MFKWLNRIINGEAIRWEAQAKSIRDEHDRRIDLWERGIDPNTMEPLGGGRI